MDSQKRVYIISLGCAKNLVDTENILGLLKKNNFHIASNLEDADIAVINTCGFIQSAVKESVATILEVVERKKQRGLELLFVIGCFVQRYGYKLRREIPEVDGWLGTGEIFRIIDLLKINKAFFSPFHIGSPTALADHTIPRIQTTPFYSLYLKIAEGCSHRCSFCTIPRLRGPFRSRGLKSLEVEAKEWVDKGVKEINVIAQDTTMYGKDLDKNVTLTDLLERLLLIQGLRWIRILYCHPSGVTDGLLGLMEAEERICPYMDLPFQHIDRSILKAMGRIADNDPWRLIERIRSLKRHVSLRTTLMVGFPGETDAIFDELYDFVSSVEFDRLGVFMFSPEKGTPAARIKGIPEAEIAKERLDILMGLQADISEKKNQALLGRTIPVLIEGESQETDLLLCGRTVTMAPEVDGQVLINKGRGLVGEISPVRISEAYPYDLVGEIVTGGV